MKYPHLEKPQDPHLLGRPSFVQPVSAAANGFQFGGRQQRRDVMAWLRGALGACAVVMALQIYSSCFVQAWHGLVMLCVNWLV